MTVRDLETNASAFAPPRPTPLSGSVYCPASHGSVAVSVAGCLSRRTINRDAPDPMRCSGKDCPRFRADDLPGPKRPLPPGARLSKTGNVYIPVIDELGRIKGGTMIVVCPRCLRWMTKSKPHKRCVEASQ